MPVYKYRVRDNKGKIIKGKIEAKDAKVAAMLLRERGFLVIDIKIPSQFTLENLKKVYTRVSYADIATMTRSLSTLIASGLPILESLTLLRNQVNNQTLKDTVEGIRHEVEGGASFAKALEKYPGIFNRLYVALIKTGEAAGMLDKVLERLADNMEKQNEFRNKIKGALIYPVIIVSGMVIVAVIMMIFVIPKLTDLYKELNVELPAVTVILINISQFMLLFWWVIALIIIGLFGFLRTWRQTKSGQEITDKLFAKVPIVGPLREKSALVEVSRTLGLLMNAGVPIIDALKLVGEASENVSVSKALDFTAQRVEKGFPMALSFAQTDAFPPIVIQMVKVGEETGKLDESFLKLSNYFESETEQLVKGLTTAIEPIIMIILGVGVGFLVISIILPIYKLTSSL
ncbi:MAG: type II secretion system F family protein [Patescibacteria group bacterium]|nr:type II secretion system F family protein [Patescibacteria group bacterium]